MLIEELQKIRDALAELWDFEHPNCEQHTQAMDILDKLIKGVDCVKAPAAEDYNGLLFQFRAMKCLLNSQSRMLSYYNRKDYSMSERRINELTACLDSEREMNAELTEEVEMLKALKECLPR